MSDARIFEVAGDELVQLEVTPFVSEDGLQELIARFPNLLAGDVMTPDEPRRWLLVRREMGVSFEDPHDRWSVDHLFVDQDGMPTLVEVKRSTDTRLRREVVGQMLDYAANAVRRWSAERLRSEFDATCEALGADPIEALRDVGGPHVDPDRFWDQVGENLAAGAIRLVFVADVIPAELRAVVEFLNEQFAFAQVFAVEITQYAANERQTLVPRLVGATARSQPTTRRRSVEELLAGAASHVGAVDEHLRAWAAERHLEVRHTATGRSVLLDGRSIALFYPAWETVEVYLSAVRQIATDGVADALRAEFQRVCPSRRLSASHLQLPTVDLAARWEEVRPVLDRYVDLLLGVSGDSG